MPRVLNKRVVGDQGVYIGRPSRYGNPFVMGRDGDRVAVVARYERYLLEHPDLLAAARRELRGRDLTCWCAPQPCHGDVLLRLVNQPMHPYADYPTSNELGLRWYHTPVGALPSITTVLGVSEPEEKRAGLERWREALGREVAAARTKHAADHGTMVHLLVERFLKGQDPYATVHGAPVPAEDVGAFNCLKLKLRDIVVWGQERAVYSPALEVAGRLDIVGTYRGTPSIIDIKTALTKLKGRADIFEYELQVAFYAFAHNELFGTQIRQGVILLAGAGGMPQEFIVDTEARLEPLIGRIATFWERTFERINDEANPS